MANDVPPDPEPDEVTQPGTPRLLGGPPEMRAIAELATMLRFYAAQLEQIWGQLRRSVLTDPQRAVLARNLRELGRDAHEAADRVQPPQATPALPDRRRR